MGKLSTSAWVLHDLGLAAGFGGPLFGKIALGEAVKDIHSEEERGLVLHDAWKRYNRVTAISLGAAAATWFIGRTLLSGRSVSREARQLVLAKDIVLGATIAAGVASMISGEIKSREAHGGAVPVRSGTEPSERTPPIARAAQRVLSVVGPMEIALAGAAIGITSVLAMKSGRSGKWSFLSRLLP
ncbi:hypothetical protein [Chondromyces crocatus]|uniref:Uncharacterized protein n=1 Tax=Chondromyces crocatus TaxID=52 RepID=A0A0K1EML1_CHOCO|nr:hypothetical protein [Chondromyces crocatus]AKT42089.1 uncharacterized protein CMC5_063120 [Chondromyces crocatus]